MSLIEFENKPSTKTPINADNLNNNFSELADRAYISETGNTSNGNYIKYSNGIMIVTQQYSKTLATTDWSTWGSCYSADLQTPPNFPIQFKTLFACVKSISNSGNNEWLYSRGGMDSVVRSGGVGVVRPNAAPGQATIIVNVIAIGTWS